VAPAGVDDVRAHRAISLASCSHSGGSSARGETICLGFAEGGRDAEQA
jgi:hypothetical protein